MNMVNQSFFYNPSVNCALFSKLILLLSNFSIMIAGYQKPAKCNGLFDATPEPSDLTCSRHCWNSSLRSKRIHARKLGITSLPIPIP